jgi:hypothetical protein
MQRGQPVTTEQVFFGEANEISIFQTLAQDFQSRQGSALTPKQQNRLGKTLEHYMREVWDVNGPMPLPQLNREVMSATAKDYQSYLRRGSITPSVQQSQVIVTDYSNQPRIDAVQQQRAIQQGLSVPPRPTFENNLLMDTGQRYEALQQERIPPQVAQRPAIPDFSNAIVATGDEPSALALYERAKALREREAGYITSSNAGPKTVDGTAVTDALPLAKFFNPPSVVNDPQNNPTLAKPAPLPIVQVEPRGVLPQDFIIKQDDIISYKETEHNLVLYSADRDWLANTNQTRYTFSVNFDPGNTRQGFYPQLTTNKKFRNISRIELVKAILPTEGLQPLTQHTSSGGGAFVNTAKLNVLSYPYVILRIPELDVNNYGSDDNLNNAFGILQYDANWYSDNTNLEDGFLGMIPKFMKCQKVYQPTPLATLQKLTIELQRPDGEPLSAVPDTVAIQNIYFSGTIDPPPAGIVSANYASVEDANTNGEYIFIQTGTYFSKWQFAEGNRIQIQGLNANQVPGGNTLAAQNLLDYLQQPGGLPIIDIATTTIGDGANAVGYANVIIVRAPHVDPTTGSVLVQPFGGSDANMSILASAINAVDTTTVTYTAGKLINLSHQTNVVLRIITRDLDPAMRVRPDNL